MEKGDFIIGGIGQQIQEELPPNLIETPIVPQTSNELPIEEQPKIVEPAIEQPAPQGQPKVVPIVEAPPIQNTIKSEPKSEPAIELDDELKRIYDFKKQTGRSVNDFFALQKDWDKISDIDIIKDKIREENSKISLNDEQLKILVGKKLGIDLSQDDDLMDDSDKLMITIEASKIRESQKELQQKYNTPLDKTEPIKEQPNQVLTDKVTLSSGQVIDQSEYNKLRQDYLTSQSKEVSELKSCMISLETGTADDKKTESFEYIYEESDKHDMLSNSSYVPAEIYMAYSDAQGNLNHKQMNEDLWWAKPQNRNKAIGKLLSLARSKGIEEVLKKETNINFETKVNDKKSTNATPIFTGGRQDLVTVKMQL